VTERLYYTDPYLAEFDANVLRVEPYEGRLAAVLDRTAFYPTSGGQPFDTGRLGSAAVIDVVDRDDERRLCSQDLERASDGDAERARIRPVGGILDEECYLERAAPRR